MRETKPLPAGIWGRKGLIGWALSLALIHGSAAAQNPWRVRSLAEIRHEGMVVQKWDTSCGAAALATLLTYDLNDPVAERAIATAMLRRATPIRVRARGGFSLLDMQEYAEARGYEADGYGEVSFDHLVKMLPAILPIKVHGYDHFVVVRAIRDGEVHFADPSYGRRRMSEARFNRAWDLKVAFVVRRPIQ
jgi:predicted double-glycine peptidase